MNSYSQISLRWKTWYHEGWKYILGGFMTEVKGSRYRIKVSFIVIVPSSSLHFVCIIGKRSEASLTAKTDLCRLLFWQKKHPLAIARRDLTMTTTRVHLFQYSAPLKAPPREEFALFPPFSVYLNSTSYISIVGCSSFPSSDQLRPPQVFIIWSALPFGIFFFFSSPRNP